MWLNLLSIDKGGYHSVSKSNKRLKQNVTFLQEQLYNNNRSIMEGPKQKKWSKHDLNSIQPLTEGQDKMFKAFSDNKHICAYGCPGTGKSMIGMYLAFLDILDNEEPYEKLILIRSAVPSRNVGFVPGTYDEKISLYELPYYDILEDLFGKKNTYHDMKDAGLINFLTTSYLRGVTWDDAIIFVDECQNFTDEEIHTVMTRVGQRSKVIITGDKRQGDLKKGEKTCFDHLVYSLKHFDDFDTVEFGLHDIVRSEFVKKWCSVFGAATSGQPAH